MSAKIPVCILGATGTVGQKFVRLLADHPWFEIAAVAASSASAGKRYGDVVRWREQSDLPPAIADLTIAECAPPLPGAVAFSALDADVAGPIEQAFARAGAYVVTNTRTHRMEPDVPLLIPEANADHLVLIDRQREAGAGAAPSSPTPTVPPPALALALAPLHRAFGIERLFVSTMQAVSGAGYPGVPSLDVAGQRDPSHRRRGGEDRAREPQDPRHARARRRGAGRLRGERAHQPGRGDRRTPGDGVGRVPPAGDAGGGDRGAAGVPRLAVRGRTPVVAQSAGRGGRARRPAAASARSRSRPRDGGDGGPHSALPDPRSAHGAFSATTPSGAPRARACRSRSCWWPTVGWVMRSMIVSMFSVLPW